MCRGNIYLIIVLGQGLGLRVFRVEGFRVSGFRVGFQGFKVEGFRSKAQG